MFVSHSLLDIVKCFSCSRDDYHMIKATIFIPQASCLVMSISHVACPYILPPLPGAGKRPINKLRLHYVLRQFIFEFITYGGFISMIAVYYHLN